MLCAFSALGVLSADDLADAYSQAYTQMYEELEYEEALKSTGYLIERLSEINPSYHDDIYYMDAQANKRLKRFDEAISSAEHALSSASQDEENYRYYLLLLIDSCMEIGKQERAIEAYETGIRLFPQVAAFTEELAVVYSDAGEADKAIAVCNRGIENNPGEMSYIVLRAELFEKAGMYAEALGDYTHVIEHSSSSSSLFYRSRSRVLKELGRLDEALDDINTYIDNATQVLGSDYELRGDILQAQGKNSAALSSLLKAWDESRGIMDTNWQLAEKIADLFLELGNYADAFDYYEKASLWADESEVSHIYRGMGYAYAKTGVFEEALYYYNSAVESDKGNGELYLERSQVLSALGRVDEAIKDLDEYIYWMELPGPEVLMQRGYLKYQRGDYEGAVEDYELARLVAPYNLDVLSNTGKLYQSLGRHEKAVECFSDFLSLCFSDSYSWSYEMYLRAYSYLEQGMVEESLEDLDILISLDEGRYEPFYLRAQIYESVGDFPKAVEDYERVLELTGGNTDSAAELARKIEELENQI